MKGALWFREAVQTLRKSTSLNSEIVSMTHCDSIFLGLHFSALHLSYPISSSLTDITFWSSSPLNCVVSVSMCWLGMLPSMWPLTFVCVCVGGWENRRGSLISFLKDWFFFFFVNYKNTSRRMWSLKVSTFLYPSFTRPMSPSFLPSSWRQYPFVVK